MHPRGTCDGDGNECDVMWLLKQPPPKTTHTEHSRAQEMAHPTHTNCPRHSSTRTTPGSAPVVIVIWSSVANGMCSAVQQDKTDQPRRTTCLPLSVISCGPYHIQGGDLHSSEGGCFVHIHICFTHLLCSRRVGSLLFKPPLL